MQKTLIEKMISLIPEREDAIKKIYDSVPLIFYRNTFNAIVAVLEARDESTAHHSERVALMAERFCMALMLPLPITEVITLIASVHDIGKVGIRDEILFKAGPLDEMEWAEMKHHPEIGAEIMLKAGLRQNVAEGVLYHHERWNGKGYPEGLKGNKIPYSSRIIAICDSTDAMMSARRYRASLGRNKCWSEIEANKSVMYDPILADVFLNYWDKIVGNLYDEEPNSVK